LSLAQSTISVQFCRFSKLRLFHWLWWFLLDMAARFGGDCTAMALQNRFRAIRRDAKLINDSIAKGVDPITLPIGTETSSGGVKGSPG
jgi:hypothetical protein